MHIFFLLPRLHSMSASPMYPGSHSQTIVRKGNVSTTVQIAFRLHGLVSRHGFLHWPLKHANLLGQSASAVHSRDGTIDTGI